MTPKIYFTSEFFQFFRELRESNSKVWFQSNKKRYESVVRDPCLNFIADFGPHLAKISKHYLADPRPVGGSLFRIHRDTRFSRDKTPYKTAAGIQFRHSHGKNAHAPGFYLHLEPGQVFAATGIWRPESEPLSKIREAIVAKPDTWKRAVSEAELRGVCRLSGESLKRPPRGYDPDHQLIEDIKRKDFMTMRELSEEDACSGGFMEKVDTAFRTPSRFMEFLTTALGLSW
jgi:uncharacterized protein (TIGR02453 family)